MTIWDVAPSRGDDDVASGRDAVATRNLLVRAARRLFAQEGYRTTTVRHIAADAGVNVALINRYFGSKEGLFKACLRRSVEELGSRSAQRPRNIDEIVALLVTYLIGPTDADSPLQLMLLMRSSGDEQADQIRRQTLETFTEQLAEIVGWSRADPATAHLLLRAQVAIAALLGLVMLRTTTTLEPLASSTPDEVTAAVRRVFTALLVD